MGSEGAIFLLVTGLALVEGVLLLSCDGEGGVCMEGGFWWEVRELLFG